jgi:rfaE bifunctional protein kinase chain/domain
MINPAQLFRDFKMQRIFIVGDVMLDHYISGKVERISPEAPVQIVNVQSFDNRAGGAANVAMNIRAAGAKAYVFSVIGKDTNGAELLRLFTKNKIDCSGIFSSTERITTLKARVIGNNHQLLRYDYEQIKALTEKEENTLFRLFVKKVKLEKPDAVILEDYNKGVLTSSLIQQLINFCNEQGIPTLVDPKQENFFSYVGCTLFKPNLKELREGLHQAIPVALKELQKATAALTRKMKQGATLITLADKGVFFSNGKEVGILPAHIRNIADVSGAGDTVVAVAALCLAARLPLPEIAHISNLAGGLVCEHPGVVSIDMKRLAEELGDS